MEYARSGLEGAHYHLKSWEKYKDRDKSKHFAEDGRLEPSQPNNSIFLIEEFLTHRRDNLDPPIPLCNAALRDFLLHAAAQRPRQNDISHGIIGDISCNSTIEDIALIDDRRDKTGCASEGRRWDNDDYMGDDIFSKDLTIPDLYERLRENRQTNGAEKRIIFIPNLTPAGALTLAATVARRTANPLRDFLHRYLLRENLFTISTSHVFVLEFHIPYLVLRRGPKITDRRRLRQEPLRKSHKLPLARSPTEDNYFYYEGQTSLLITGVDESFWTTLCLVDPWYGGEEQLREYLKDFPEGEGLDPPYGGAKQMKDPFFNSREYYLAIFSRRITQATKEITVVIETLDERMVYYADRMNSVTEDDENQTHIRKVDGVIRTIQLFRNCLLGIINAWETFSATHMFYLYADEKKKELWGRYKADIFDQIAKLNSLKRNTLDPKLDLYKGIHAGLATASSLRESAAATRQAESAVRQADTAIHQGENIQMLTRMATFYLPLMFTAAFFSMSFVHFPHPWFMFLVFLIVSVVFNFLIASNSRLLGIFF